MYVNEITLSGKLTVDAKKGVRAVAPYGQVKWIGANIRVTKLVTNNAGEEFDSFVTNKVLNTSSPFVAEAFDMFAGQDVVIVGELVTRKTSKDGEPLKFIDIINVTSVEPVVAEVH